MALKAATQASSKAATRADMPDFAARLQHVVDKFSLSEVARRTGYAVSNIHSYLHGTRVPGELISMLIAHFNVSPRWLYCGEGSAFSSDVDARMAVTAADVLGLVQAMEQAAKSNLGAMGGAQPSVRELDFLLTRHRELKEKLARRSRAALDNLLDEGRSAFIEGRLDAARARVRTAERIRKLCDDTVLLVRHKALDAALANMAGESKRAFARHKEAFMLMLSAWRDMASEGSIIAYNYSVALERAGELREACAVCDAMLVLDAGDSPESKRNLLKFQRGWLDVQTGDVQRGLRTMNEVASADALFDTGDSWPFVMSARVYAGLLDFEEALAKGKDDANKAVFLMRFAAFRENAQWLERIYDHFLGGEKAARAPVKSLRVMHLTCLLRAMRQKDRQAHVDFEKSVDYSRMSGSPLYHQFSVAACACQMARLSGAREAARARLDAAEECLKAMPPATTAGLQDRALHYRNVLELARECRVDEALVQRARGFFIDLVAAGYHFFLEQAQRARDPGV